MHFIQRCSSERHLHIIHAIFLTHGFHHHTVAISRLILAACSLRTTTGLLYASLILRHSPAPPNSFIYNTLIHAHARGPEPHCALHYFSMMLRSPEPFSTPDHHSFPFALAACVAVPDFSFGTQIQAIVIKNGLAATDHYVQTAALRLYAQVQDDLIQARKLFDEIPQTDAVHVDVLMNGYLRRGFPFDALELFKEMFVDGLIPDKHVITTALTACSHAGALKEGAWIHMCLLNEHPGFLEDAFISSSLVSMYAKCGCIEEAVKVFDSAPERNSFMWASMIGGFAVHGLANDAFCCLNRMKDEDGVKPDGIVILSVMAACAHAGLVDEGLRLLAEMISRYEVVPEHEHYSCAVNMLCRVGRLADALELIRRMPMRPLASVWGSLLTGCGIHNNVELAELAVAELQTINGEGEDDDGVFVQMSNIFLNSNKLEDARRIRKLIGRRGVKKTAACSEIEVDGEVSSFVAGDPLHPQLLDIWSVLNIFRDHAGDEPWFESGDFEVGVLSFG
ncbi:putative pentatricopeptide repeat-containing protein At3g28640 [Phalaenopsis equestris]|uniref:putative pentatricopeptide repeat-containing protein At3g28640 n=1 Tax=Phalaenopsis equestris TaxID=78828 RepID=UPI0009E2F333|nr:putative pentatricopeptide repeat-containing protein At3g28640 [Phalaenopsis equestris]XP_020587608.1 putative pentatricopeptide repeat-containing protein At3g28640 [Phalaenopsis equestris]